MTKREQQIQKLMDLRGYSREEATQIVLDDEATDKGVIHPWNLTKEQERENKKNRQVDKSDREKREAPKREKKVDNVKKELINLIIENLEVEDLNIINDEREVEFIYKERKFKITLSAPRK